MDTRSPTAQRLIGGGRGPKAVEVDSDEIECRFGLFGSFSRYSCQFLTNEPNDLGREDPSVAEGFTQVAVQPIWQIGPTNHSDHSGRRPGRRQINLIDAGVRVRTP